MCPISANVCHSNIFSPRRIPTNDSCPLLRLSYSEDNLDSQKYPYGEGGQKGSYDSTTSLNFVTAFSRGLSEIFRPKPILQLLEKTREVSDAFQFCLIKFLM
ncbi:hypothetical protein TNCT_66741 [Trichonephila clavata]|uniref:Uncharacterized protein n=1 Tax=Trichonephila clavata TaxID=2740835 RepID=A0A8X6LHB3_TRICU|nr:hypothetical protein TNCT_66741 [Trichonephila clavata]